MYFTDRGLEELNQRRGEESITFEWLTDQMRTFVDLNPEFETPVERLATWLARLEDDGCARYVVTDVTKDGTLRGPNLELLAQVMAKTDKPVVASGGISSLQDITDLRALVSQGLEGAILGKSLYAGKFTLEAALEIANAR